MASDDPRVQRNCAALESNLRAFRDDYWPIYEHYGFSFPAAYNAWLLECYVVDGIQTINERESRSSDDDDADAWKRG